MSKPHQHQLLVEVSVEVLAAQTVEQVLERAVGGCKKLIVTCDAAASYRSSRSEKEVRAGDVPDLDLDEVHASLTMNQGTISNTEACAGCAADIATLDEPALFWTLLVNDASQPSGVLVARDLTRPTIPPGERLLVERLGCRVTPGRFRPEVPTDPDVQNSRIRLLASWIR
jgi:hypothetical protein